jgi:RNA polymerase sigma-70 factor, ECF subfamily
MVMGEKPVEKVFNDLYKTYHQDLFKFLFYMVRNREQAEDLVQEVYIRVLKSFHHFKGESSEKTWLFAIARNVAIDSFRKQKGWKERMLDRIDFPTFNVDDGSPLPDEILFQREDLQLMYLCLEQCSPDQRSVIILRFIQELSIHETAQVLGWNESKVKTTQHRAIKHLKTLMEAEVSKYKAG